MHPQELGRIEPAIERQVTVARGTHHAQLGEQLLAIAAPLVHPQNVARIDAVSDGKVLVAMGAGDRLDRKARLRLRPHAARTKQGTGQLDVVRRITA